MLVAAATLCAIGGVLGLMGIATALAAFVRAADPEQIDLFRPQCSGGGPGCAAHSRGQGLAERHPEQCRGVPRSHVASTRSACRTRTSVMRGQRRGCRGTEPR